MSHIQSCEMKPLHFGSRLAIPLSPAKPRALLQTKLMGSLLCKTLPEPALQPLDNVMALPLWPRMEQSHWLGFWMATYCFEGRRKALFPCSWHDYGGSWALWSVWSLRCPKAWPAAQRCFTNCVRANFNGHSVSWSHCSRGWTMCS